MTTRPTDPDQPEVGPIDELLRLIVDRLRRAVQSRDIGLLVHPELTRAATEVAAAALRRSSDGSVMLYAPAVPVLTDYYLLIFRVAGSDAVHDPAAAVRWLTLGCAASSGEQKAIIAEVRDSLAISVLDRDVETAAEELAVYDCDGDRGSLDSAISRLTAAVDMAPADHEGRLGWMARLASALHRRYDADGDLADLRKACDLRRTVIDTMPEDVSNKALLLSTLARGLIAIAQHTDDPSGLDEAISAARAAIHRTPAGSGYESLRLYRLGQALVLSVRHSSDVNALRRAVTALVRSVDVASADEKGGSVHQLVSAYNLLIELTGVTGADEKIATLQRLLTDTDLPRATTMSYLGNARYERYELTGDVADLEASVHLHEQVVQQRPASGLARSNLSNALRERARWSGARSDLDEAIHQARTAVETVQDDDAVAVAQRNLAVGLLSRYEMTRDRADLDKARAVAQTAVQHMSEGDSQAYVILSGLGTVLLRCYEADERPDDLHEAIRWIQAAIDASPPGTPGHAALLSNLSHLLRDRFDLLTDPADIDASLDAAHASSAMGTGHLVEWLGLLNLANTLKSRYELRHDREDLQRAMCAGRHRRRGVGLGSTRPATGEPVPRPYDAGARHE